VTVSQSITAAGSGVAYGACRGRFGTLGVALLLLCGVLLGGCATGAGKTSVAAAHVVAVEQVLSAMADALEEADAKALAALWDAPDRADAQRRITDGMDAGRLSAPTLSLIEVRVEGAQVFARVTWQGRFAGDAVSGGFGLELTDDGGLKVVAASGEVPWGVASRFVPDPEDLSGTLR